MRLFVPVLALLLVSAPLVAQSVQVLETRADGTALLAHSEASFAVSATDARTAIVRLLPEKPLQRMDGFGASLTGSSAELLLRLPEAERNAVLHEIFDPAGPLGLTLLRQPIGASDFSAHGNYSYDDVAGDTALAHFSPGPDAAIFPLLRQALAINPSLRLMVLPWSAPAWMKTTHSMKGGALDEQYLAPYAAYLDRTVAAYAQAGVPVYALALQNEPENENSTYPTQVMSAKQEIALARKLRPLLRSNGRTTLLLGYEHNWNDLDYPRELLAATPRLFDGISFHCYRGDESAQRTLLYENPHTSVWFTECSGTNRTEFAGDLLWQSRHLLLGAPRNGARSVMLWNLVLDPRGGPHNGGCSDCRALLTLSKDNHLTRNVEFYLLAHAAPFVHPDAQQMETAGNANPSLLTTAYRNIDGTWALLALNSGPAELAVRVELEGKAFTHTLAPRSLTTFAWGTAMPTISEGLYRLALGAADTCLAAGADSKNAASQPCSSDPAQLWTLTRLSGGRFEVRNLATTQDLTRGFALTLVDGDHVAPSSLVGSPASFCLGAAGCAEPLHLLPANASK
jgi:glucosylceramidase